MRGTVDPAEMYRIIYTDHDDPFTVLGAHEVEVDGSRGTAVRAFLPDAEEAFVIEEPGGREVRHRMERLHAHGFFEIFLPGRTPPLAYELERVDALGARERFLDSYAFLPTLTNFDLHLFGQGKNYKVYEKLGAHKVEVQGVGGVQFAVWAPQARSVSVIGSFNGWDRRKHAMRRLDCGVWEIFVPGLDDGELYKYQIKTHQEVILDKADPYGFRMQVAPESASIVHTLGRYQWQDRKWMADRAKQSVRERPMSIYEVHLGSWQRAPGEKPGEDRPLTYREMAETLVPYVQEMGYTHVEFLPVMEHPFVGSWGYQVTGYYAPTSRYGAPEDLMALIDAFHQAGIGVILDWVPGHFPKDAFALGRFDGTGVYEHIDPRQGEHPDWGTYVFNFGRNEVRNFLVGNALFWLEYYHVDGLRVDAISSMLYLDFSRAPGQWVPNRFGGRENLEAIDFLREVNDTVRERFPGTFVVAEESTAWPGVTRPTHLGGLGFDLKWNMGWMHDTLAYLAKDPIFRKYEHGKLTFSIWYAFSEAYVLPLSHDEVVHLKKSITGKMPGDMWQQLANTRLLYGYQYGHPGKKLLFMGGEIGQWREWNHDRALDWELLDHPWHRGLQRFVQDLNRLYRDHPALWEMDCSHEGFEWVDLNDADRSIIAFLRKAKDPEEALLFVYNFTPVPRSNYRVGVDRAGTYDELLNSDSEIYGGSNLGNAGQVVSEEVPWHGRPHSLNMLLPPLAMLVLRWRRPARSERGDESEGRTVREPEEVPASRVSGRLVQEEGRGDQVGDSSQTVPGEAGESSENPSTSTRAPDLDGGEGGA